MKAIFLAYLAVVGLALGTQVMAYLSQKASHRKH